MEDEVNPRPPQALNGTVFDELSFNQITVLVCELVDKVEQDRTLVFSHLHDILVQSSQLQLSGIKHFIDLLAEGGNALQDMLTEDFVQRFAQERDPQLVSVERIGWVLVEEVLFNQKCLSDAHIVFYLLLGAAFHSEVP